MKLFIPAFLLIIVAKGNEQPKPQPKPLPQKQVPAEKVKKVSDPNKPIIIRIRYRTRELIPHEQVGLNKDMMPFPCSKKQLEFECLCCGVRAWTHWVVPHYPQCSKCKAVMIENIK